MDFGGSLPPMDANANEGVQMRCGGNVTVLSLVNCPLSLVGTIDGLRVIGDE